MTLVGTIKGNKVFLHANYYQRNKEETTNQFQSVLLFECCDISTLFSQEEQTGHTIEYFYQRKRHFRGKKAADIIHFCNRTKSSVDTVNQMIKYYSVKRRTNRWPMAVFSNLIDLSNINALVLWNETHPEWNVQAKHRRRLFLTEVAMNLVSRYEAL